METGKCPNNHNDAGGGVGMTGICAIIAEGRKSARPNRRIRVRGIEQPPAMMENGLLTGCTTSTVEIDAGR